MWVIYTLCSVCFAVALGWSIWDAISVGQGLKTRGEDTCVWVLALLLLGLFFFLIKHSQSSTWKSSLYRTLISNMGI